MKKSTKIILGLGATAGIVYFVVKNKERIIGKIGKLSRMESADEIIKDLGNTAGNLFNEALGGLENLYKYVVSGGDMEAYRVNPKFWADVEEVTKDMPENEAILLRGHASNLVYDIRNWNPTDNMYSGIEYEDGMMPAPFFINWDNLRNLPTDKFNKVVEMANIMLQYNYPNISEDFERDMNVKDLHEYIKNPPAIYNKKNQVYWNGRPPHTNIKPKEVFYELNRRFNSIFSTLPARKVVRAKNTPELTLKNFKQI